MKTEKNRLTVIDQVIFQEAGQPTPVVVSSRFCREIEAEETPYQRKLTISSGQWTKLDLAWVAEVGCGMMVVEFSAVAWSVNPPKEESVSVNNSSVGISFQLRESQDGADIVIRHKESARFEPGHDEIYLRAIGKDAIKVVVTAIPR